MDLVDAARGRVLGYLPVLRDRRRTRFHFVFRYLLPDLGGADVFRRARFADSIERTVELYVERVARAGTAGPVADPVTA